MTRKQCLRYTLTHFHQACNLATDSSPLPHPLRDNGGTSNIPIGRSDAPWCGVCGVFGDSETPHLITHHRLPIAIVNTSSDVSARRGTLPCPATPARRQSRPHPHLRHSAATSSTSGVPQTRSRGIPPRPRAPASADQDDHVNVPLHHGRQSRAVWDRGEAVTMERSWRGRGGRG